MGAVVGDSARLKWVRSQPCCSCGYPGPSEAHHHTDGETDPNRSRKALGGKRGLSQKADDSQTMPLCVKCHGCLHAFRGPFADFDNQRRREWQTEQVRVHSERYELEGQADATPVRKVERVRDVEARIEELVTIYSPGSGNLRLDLKRFARFVSEETRAGRAF